MTIHHPHNKIFTKKATRGFTLIEVLIAIVLTALLMGGMAVAINGALVSYGENSSIAERCQTSRALLSRMSREISSATNVEWINSPQTLIINPSESNQISYTLNTDGGLVYTRSGNSYTLLGSDDGITVQSMPVALTAASDEPTKILLVTIQLNLVSNGRPYSVRTSATLKRNLKH